MYLLGFGHGVSIAAESHGAGTLLWTETRAAGSGFGTGLARFPFAPGTMLHASQTRPYGQLAKGYDELTCAIDPVYGRMVVRARRVSDRVHIYRVFRLEDASAGSFGSPLSAFAQPAAFDAGGDFQGYTLLGSYRYAATGKNGQNNIRLWSGSATSGAVVQGNVLSHAGEARGRHSHHEPEGLAIYRTAAGQLRLIIGVAMGAGGDRRACLFHKDELVW